MLDLGSLDPDRLAGRLARRLSRRLTPGTYDGALAGLIPVDLALSLGAKRSFLLYRLWERYTALTEPLFERRHRASGVPADGAQLAALDRDGATLVEGAEPAGEVAEARAWLEERYAAAHAEAKRRGPAGSARVVEWSDDGIGYQIERSGGRTRLFLDGAERERRRLPSLVLRFLDHPAHRALAEAYFRSTAVTARQPYCMAEVLEPAPMGEPWHVDCVRPTLKSMLLLDDVGEATGPFRYLRGSASPGPRRDRIHFRICRSGQASAYYFDDDDVARFEREARVFTGRAGDTVLFNTQGIHAGTRCTAGRRLALVNGYRPLQTTRLNPRMFRDPAPLPHPWER